VLVSWSRDEYYRRYYRREEGVRPRRDQGLCVSLSLSVCVCVCVSLSLCNTIEGIIEGKKVLVLEGTKVDTRLIIPKELR